MKEEYSTEWTSVLEAANEYQKQISLFLACSDSIKVYDLKKALLDCRFRRYPAYTIKDMAQFLYELRYYLGTPTQMYDTKGEKTWDAVLDIYGSVRTFVGRSLSECPFRYQLCGRHRQETS
jgi:hypothetical protein